eukprot:3156448-Prymnesium_polylepis.1
MRSSLVPAGMMAMLPGRTAASAAGRVMAEQAPAIARYTVSAESRCICAVSVLYLALYFWYGGAPGGVTVSQWSL